MTKLKEKKELIVQAINHHTSLNIFLLQTKEFMKLPLLKYLKPIEIYYILDNYFVNIKNKIDVSKTMEKFSANHLFKIEKQLIQQNNDLTMRFDLLKKFFKANSFDKKIRNKKKLNAMIKKIQNFHSENDLEMFFANGK